MLISGSTPLPICLFVVFEKVKLFYNCILGHKPSHFSGFQVTVHCNLFVQNLPNLYNEQVDMNRLLHSVHSGSVTCCQLQIQIF